MDKIFFSLQKITTEQFAILDENIADKANIELKSSLRFGINRATNFLAVFSLFRFEANNIPFLLIENACHFKIDKKTWDSFKTETEFIFPRDLLIHLSVLTVGTTRGVLHAKIENTKLSDFMIPLVNINRLVDPNIRFDLEISA